MDKFTKVYFKIISEAEKTDEVNVGSDSGANLEFEADFRVNEKTVETKKFTSFSDLKDAINDYLGRSFDDLSHEIYNLGADVETDMQFNYNLDPYDPDADEDELWLKYFKACIDNEDTSMIKVHDGSDDYDDYDDDDDDESNSNDSNYDDDEEKKDVLFSYRLV